jgi:hypothetical protein
MVQEQQIRVRWTFLIFAPQLSDASKNISLGGFEMAGLGQLELGGMRVTGIDRLVGL